MTAKSDVSPGRTVYRACHWLTSPSFAVDNLRWRSHNLLRLTRILKHLSEITPLQLHAAPLVLFFTSQHSEGNFDFTRGKGMAGDSLELWWSHCFRNEAERKEVRSIVMDRGAFGRGTWGTKEFEAWYDERAKAGTIGWLEGSSA